jgi:hypothetical protein
MGMVLDRGLRGAYPLYRKGVRGAYSLGKTYCLGYAARRPFVHSTYAARSVPRSVQEFSNFLLFGFGSFRLFSFVVPG